MSYKWNTTSWVKSSFLYFSHSWEHYNPIYNLFLSSSFLANNHAPYGQQWVRTGCFSYLNSLDDGCLPLSIVEFINFKELEPHNSHDTKTQNIGSNFLVQILRSIILGSDLWNAIIPWQYDNYGRDSRFGYIYTETGSYCFKNPIKNINHLSFLESSS